VTVLTGLLGMIGVLLAAGGVSKARQPRPTVQSFAAIGLRPSPRSVQILATGEVLVGAALVLVGGWVIAAVGAALFAAFTVVSLRLARLGDSAGSCGCFGERSARPSRLHVAVDAGATIVLAVAAVVDPPGLLRHSSEWPAGQVVALAGLMLLGGYLLVALMTVLPDTIAAIAAADEPALDRGASWSSS
jgi:hypothetical protein